MVRRLQSNPNSMRKIVTELGNVSGQVMDTQMAVVETYEESLSAHDQITDLQNAVVEIYEMILGG